MSEKTLYFNQPFTGEERTLWTLIAFSLLAHVLFFLVNKSNFLQERAPLYEEWEIEGDLVSDVELSAPKKTTLPNSQSAEEATVPTNLLPQLPKKFAIQEQKTDDSIAETSDGTPEDKKKSDSATSANSENNLNIKQDPNEANRLAMDDALRRLAMEKLRNEKKVSDKLTSEQPDAIARLKREMEANKNVNAGVKGAGLTIAQQNIYRGKLRQHIGRFWSLPEAYNLKDANLRVTIAIVINESGGLIASSIKTSSGDPMFDELAYNAVKNSVPVPIPPKGQAGEEILLNFTPKSF